MFWSVSVYTANVPETSVSSVAWGGGEDVHPLNLGVVCVRTGMVERAGACDCSWTVGAPGMTMVNFAQTVRVGKDSPGRYPNGLLKPVSWNTCDFAEATINFAVKQTEITVMSCCLEQWVLGEKRGSCCAWAGEEVNGGADHCTYISVYPYTYKYIYLV